MTKVRITDTSLRDAHQSLWATRMRTADILQIIDVVDKAGYYSLECWGGATFDVCLRFLRENPWERLRLIKAHCKTPLQMLLRGQNVLGYKHYPDDVLVRFIELSALNGIDIFRIFDALNDTRNMECAIKAVKQVGAHAQGTISYTVSPVHTDKAYVELARELEQLGADSICIKDMAGILTPGAASRLVGALAKAVKIPVQLHSHMTSGMAMATYCSAVSAGAGAVDACVSSMSGCSSQPPLQSLVSILDSMGFETGLDMDAVRKEDEHFAKLAPKRLPASASRKFVDVGVLRHHIPGGMISNLRSQLSQQNALDRLDEVLDELPRVRADMGYPPLVTPTSQIIGIQSVLNVLGGKRYGMVTRETVDYVKGMYGRSPAPVDPSLARQILKGEKKITRRPADFLKPGLAAAADAIPQGLVKAEEDILSYCIFPEVALDYFKWRAMDPAKRPPIPADVEAAAATAAAPAPAAAPSATPAQASAEAGEKILAPLNGTFYRRPGADKPDFVADGQMVDKGAIVCVVEAMKLMNNITAPRKCKVVKFLVEHGAAVAKGQPLAVIE